MPKIRNIIIFIVILAVLILGYVFLVKPSSSNQANLVSSPASTSLPGANSSGTGATNVGGTSSATGDFLNLLLSVNTIKLDDSIFSDPAFSNLHDSSIILTPDGTEGRANPFAPLGSDVSPMTAPAAPATPTPVLPSTSSGSSTPASSSTSSKKSATPTPVPPPTSSKKSSSPTSSAPNPFSAPIPSAPPATGTAN